MKLKKQTILLRGGLSILLVLTLGVLGFKIFFNERLYPGVFVSGVFVSGLTKSEAENKLNVEFLKRAQKDFKFEYSGASYTIIPKQSLEVNSKEAIARAFEYGRSKAYFEPINLKADIKFKEGLNSQIAKIAKEVNSPAIDAQIKLIDNKLNVTPSQEGKVLDEEKLLNIIEESINSVESVNKNIQTQRDLPIKKVYPNLSYESALKIKESLDKIKLEPLILEYEGERWIIDLASATELIDLSKSKPSLISGNLFGEDFNIASVKIGNKEYSDSKFILNEEKLNEFLASIAKEIDRPTVEPLFAFDPSISGQTRVTEFKAPINGKKLKIKEASILISQAILEGNTNEIELPVQTLEPKNKLTNDLGIKELIGRGISNFAGSIPNRIYNIELASSKLNGILIKPDEVFSFNNTVGDISSNSGYKQAYVIKSGRTVLDDGGGVCQVSTTLFRSVLNSGLPVLERTAHAYRVGYYEQGFPPGLDATIFSPNVDFKFKNDTGAHILIQAYTGGNSLYIDFYGTSDGRIVNLSRSVITNQTPPPPELRQDDPTLPKGTVKQVDFAAWGANVVFSRTVTRGNETLIQESFRSNYRPWQAIYLVGTQ